MLPLPGRSSPRTARPRRRPARLAVLAAALAGALAGCTLRSLAVDTLAGALTSGGDVFASDDDPQLVREALPFALKTMEALVVESPDDADLLRATASGFTQYTAGFVEADARALEDVDYEAYLATRDRALRLYLRARDYGLRGLELRHPGLGERLRSEPDVAAAAIGPDEIELCFWTGAAWGSAISVGLHRPEVVADVDAVRALLARSLVLDEAWGEGAVHEALIAIESLPEMMGGSPERARFHYGRAVALAGGHAASPHVVAASSLFVPAQDRAGFDRALEAALAVDVDAAPARRLQNTLAQDRARWLRARAADLFLEDLEEGDE